MFRMERRMIQKNPEAYEKNSQEKKKPPPQKKKILLWKKNERAKNEN